MRKLKSSHIDSAGAVGQRLKEARLDAGLSQRQLAFPGCTPAYISRIEAGQRQPSLQLLAELAKRLGVSTAYLATGHEETDDAEPDLALVDAELALRFGESDEAERLYEEALGSATTTRQRGDALAGLGHVAFRDADAELAIDRFEAALQAYGTDETGHPLLAEVLGRAYAMRGDLSSSIAVFERCLRAAEAAGNDLAGLRFSVLLANALIDNGDLDRAEELLAKAIASTGEETDISARARLYWSQSRLYALQNDSALAARYGRRALDLLETTEDTYATARAHHLLAHIELDRGRADEALELIERGRALLGTSANRFEIARFRLEEARALALKGQIDEAAAVAMDAAGVLAETMPADAGRAYFLIAESASKVGQTARAIELYELAIEHLRATRNRYLVEAYSRLGEVLEGEGRQGEALQVFKEGMRVQADVGRSLTG